MKKLLHIGLISVCVGLIQGCALFDFDGNGRIDPLAYLSTADVSIGWVNEAGTPFRIAMGEDGIRIEGEFVDHRGIKYAMTEDGGFAITDPNGFQIQIKRKE